jgi:hypothetical protein
MIVKLFQLWAINPGYRPDPDMPVWADSNNMNYVQTQNVYLPEPSYKTSINANYLQPRLVPLGHRISDSERCILCHDTEEKEGAEDK